LIGESFRRYLDGPLIFTSPFVVVCFRWLGQRSSYPFPDLALSDIPYNSSPFTPHLVLCCLDCLFVSGAALRFSPGPVSFAAGIWLFLSLISLTTRPRVLPGPTSISSVHVPSPCLEIAPGLPRPRADYRTGTLLPLREAFFFSSFSFGPVVSLTCLTLLSSLALVSHPNGRTFSVANCWHCFGPAWAVGVPPFQARRGQTLLFDKLI